MSLEYSSHDHIHQHEPSPELSVFERTELTRRQLIAHTAGISSALFLPAFLAACGDTQLTDNEGNLLPAAGQLEEINKGATATQQAVRLNPPKPQEPVLVVNPGSFVIDGDRNLKIVSYSIDDVPGRTIVRDMMNTCKNEGLEGVLGFFAVGIYMNSYADVTAEIASRGYRVHNHSMSHNYSIQTNINEVDPMQQAIKNHTGVDNKIFRNPGGYVNQALLSFLASRGLFYLWTSVDLGDWRSPRPHESVLLQRHDAALVPGRHFLLHGSDSHGTTSRALGAMFRSARSRGYEIVSPYDHMCIGNPTLRAMQLMEAQLQIQDTYIQDGRFQGISELEANWIITLETSIEESARLSKDNREMLEHELKTRKQALGIL